MHLQWFRSKWHNGGSNFAWHLISNGTGYVTWVKNVLVFFVCLFVCLCFFLFWVSLVGITSARKMPVVRFKFTMPMSFITNSERFRWGCVVSLLFTCLNVSLFVICMFARRRITCQKRLGNQSTDLPTNQKGGFCFRIYVHWQFCTELTFCPTDVSFTGTFKSFHP